MTEPTARDTGVFSVLLLVLAVLTTIAAMAATKEREGYGLFFVAGCLAIGAGIAAPRRS